MTSLFWNVYIYSSTSIPTPWFQIDYCWIGFPITMQPYIRLVSLLGDETLSIWIHNIWLSLYPAMLTREMVWDFVPSYRNHSRRFVDSDQGSQSWVGNVGTVLLHLHLSCFVFPVFHAEIWDTLKKQNPLFNLLSVLRTVSPDWA